MRTWERGAGLTKACGSAACAAAVAAARLKRTGRKVTVTLPGGDLAIEWRETRRPCADDRPGRITSSRAASIRRCFPARRDAMSDRHRHLRLPAQHLRIRGDARARRATAGLDDAVIVNTCAVTGEAVRQARQTIRKLRRDTPDARIVVTGCAAQTEPQMFAAMPEVDRVLGNEEEAATAWTDAREASRAPARQDRRSTTSWRSARRALHLIDGIEGRARAFVQVQNGCDHRCTFCIIPYGRGNSRSVPMGEVVAQVAPPRRQRLSRDRAHRRRHHQLRTGPARHAAGSARWSSRSSSDVPELTRLRLSSIDSVEADDDLLDCARQRRRG